MNGQRDAGWTQREGADSPHFPTFPQRRKSSERRLDFLIRPLAASQRSLEQNSEKPRAARRAKQSQANPFKAIQKPPRSAGNEVLLFAGACAADETNPSRPDLSQRELSRRGDLIRLGAH